ncbi:MAG: MEDS domain-containing protein [Actinobacteria bacterium]|nr:MEDS domain-containing protein [Actinomycetota bacterium]
MSERSLRCVGDSELSPAPENAEIDDHGHLVQFYEKDAYLAESVKDFVLAGLERGESAIIVATKEHRQTIDELLEASDLDIQELRNSGRFVLLDAGETLSRFMVDNEPEQALFSAAMGSVIARAAEAGRGMRIFGEMVAVLWDEGNVGGAIRLEELWNELAKVHPFSLLCAYPLRGFGTENEAFVRVCACHTRVIPTESYTALAGADERLRAITELQLMAAGQSHQVARDRQRHALELNRSVVQDLAAAKMAFDLGHPEMGASAITQALRKATAIVSELLAEGDDLGPGDLRSN